MFQVEGLVGVIGQLVQVLEGGDGRTLYSVAVLEHQGNLVTLYHVESAFWTLHSKATFCDQQVAVLNHRKLNASIHVCW